MPRASVSTPPPSPPTAVATAAIAAATLASTLATKTPLILACMEGHGAVVDVLLAAGAKTDCLYLKLTAVQWAHRNGHAHCRAKLQSGSDAAPPMPRPDQCGPSIEVDQSTPIASVTAQR